ncbi:metallophosphoesterase [Colwelliaceae bacterium 6441]
MSFNKFFAVMLSSGLVFNCFAIEPLSQIQPFVESSSKEGNNVTPSGEDLPIINDGPYVVNENNQLTATWFCNNQQESKTVAFSNNSAVIDNCNYPIEVDRIKFKEHEVLEYQGDFNLVATSDFHGQFDLMMTLLKNNNIVDSQGHWNFADGHFVITGDVFDRGDKVTEILWFLYRLEQEAELAGGKLHLLLGNHEVMVLNGDLRYLHPEYVEVAKRLNMPFEDLYAKGTVLGDWLRTKPVLVKVNNMLFAHGGFHPSLAQEKRSLAEINSIFKQNLVKAELAQPREGWGKYLHKTHGPIWYRGYFKDNGASSDEIDLLLKHFDIEFLVVGHTSQKQVETRHQGRVIAIDSSIKNGKYGELFFAEQGKKWRGTLSGEKLPLSIK